MTYFPFHLGKERKVLTLAQGRVLSGLDDRMDFSLVSLGFKLFPPQTIFEEAVRVVSNKCKLHHFIFLLKTLPYLPTQSGLKLGLRTSNREDEGSDPQRSVSHLNLLSSLHRADSPSVATQRGRS